MKFFPFKILILCILMPPLLYIGSLHFFTRYLQGEYTQAIRNTYMGDTAPLLAGQIRLQAALRKNIDRYLRSRAMRRLGIRPEVTVITQKGKILYPAVFADDGAPHTDPMQVASRNFKLMQEGLIVHVRVPPDHNTLFSYLLLAFYILLAILIFSFFYRQGMKKARAEEAQKAAEIQRLQELESAHEKRLSTLDQEREKLTRSLEKEKQKASKSEDEMLEEMISLESRIEENLALQNEQKEEIEELKAQIRTLEQEKQGGKPRKRDPNMVQKRFKTLYKNVSLHDRAIDGFMELAEDMKIKGEEVIHQLNDDPQMVPIKRKVFGKKGSQTVLEVIFGYRGRLYFRKTKDKRIEILAVGTKNTQSKDLEFINKF